MKPVRRSLPRIDSDRGQDSLCVRDLGLELGGRTILDSIELALPETGLCAVIGPSGAGKSSLLRCLNGLHRDWTGEIRLFGSDARRFPGGVGALRQRVGLIAQKPAVFPCSIRRNVLFGLSRRALKRMRRNRIEETLRQVGLWDEVRERLDDAAETLSIGQQQRLCIARALMLEPGMLLLDEPTASLDSQSKRTLEATLRRLAPEMPLLCVTHDLDQARRIADRVVFLCGGQLIESGATEAFFTQPLRIESREFLRWSVCDCD